MRCNFGYSTNLPISLSETRRLLISCWSSGPGVPARDIPTSDLHRYDWIIGAVPTAKKIGAAISPTKCAISDKLRSAKLATTAYEDHVVRANGHFVLPRKLIGFWNYRERSAIAVLGRSGFLLDEIPYAILSPARHISMPYRGP